MKYMSVNQFYNQRVEGMRNIYTSSPFARQNLIYLQEIGTSHYLKPYCDNRNELSSYLFFVVLKGSGELKYQDVIYTLSVGDCALINCNMKYAMSSSTDLWTLSWIHFNGPTMHSIYQKYIERCGAPCFKSENSDIFHERHNRIFQLSDDENKSYVRDMQLMGELTLLLTDLMEQCWHKALLIDGARSQRKWIPIREYIDENFVYDIQLDDLERKFHINKFYLTRKFRESYGITINQYITNKRVNYAKELLRFSDFSITEIARKSGFNDSAYFTRVFKSVEGVSPSAFKKEWNHAFDNDKNEQ